MLDSTAHHFTEIDSHSQNNRNCCGFIWLGKCANRGYYQDGNVTFSMMDATGGAHFFDGIFVLPWWTRMLLNTIKLIGGGFWTWGVFAHFFLRNFVDFFPSNENTTCFVHNLSPELSFGPKISDLSSFVVNWIEFHQIHPLQPQECIASTWMMYQIDSLELTVPMSIELLNTQLGCRLQAVVELSCAQKKTLTRIFFC